MNNIIGVKIQEHRQKNVLTQEALAEKLNVSRQSVSKWELGQALPDIDKIVAMARLFGVTTDELLHAHSDMPKRNDLLRLGSIYLITKNMQKAIQFYEKLLSMRASTRHPVFAEFFFDNHCIALMDEARLSGHDYSRKGDSDYKFVLNFYVQDLIVEHYRVKNLNIGEVTEIMQSNPNYYFFHLKDPDGNVVEITGQVHDTRRNENMETIYCQSCAMPMSEEQYGSLEGGTKTKDYCHYCFVDGTFTTEQTFEEAVEGNIRFWLEHCNNDEEAARKRIKEVFSTLKRWK
ncbi:MAG: helix-turn-helix domain-containing protein [Defluviitaleaceae bacterium]|nr:helix-turn-helix domain-containing protein [Defluviitaleaceae bacterium]